MLKYKVRPHKYRCLTPLLISAASVAFFLPFYLSVVVLCTSFPAVRNCAQSYTLHVWWFFLGMFLAGVVAAAYRAYRDFCRGEIRVMRLRV